LFANGEILPHQTKLEILSMPGSVNRVTVTFDVYHGGLEIVPIRDAEAFNVLPRGLGDNG
jgi:hypothetical protein